MLIGIATLFILLFAVMAGPKNDPVIIHMHKYAKKVVVDKERKDLIATELKAVKGLQKSYQKDTKHFIQILANLVSQQSTSKEAFQSMFESVLEYEVKTNEDFFTHRQMIQETLTKEEWDTIVESMQKDLSKDEKSRQKQLANFAKSLQVMKEKVLVQFDDEENKQKASDHLDQFITTVKELGNEILTYNEIELEMLLRKESTTEDLRQYADDYNRQWMDLLDDFATLHGQLAELASDDEWKSIAKWLNKI